MCVVCCCSMLCLLVVWLCWGLSLWNLSWLMWLCWWLSFLIMWNMLFSLCSVLMCDCYGCVMLGVKFVLMVCVLCG